MIKIMFFPPQCAKLINLNLPFLRSDVCKFQHHFVLFWESSTASFSMLSTASDMILHNTGRLHLTIKIWLSLAFCIVCFPSTCAVHLKILFLPLMNWLAPPT